MAKRLGTASLLDGLSLLDAAMTLTSAAQRAQFDQAKTAWESNGKPSLANGWRREDDVFGRRVVSRRGRHPLLVNYERAHAGLLKEVQSLLRSGDLVATAMELGNVAGEYRKVDPVHWQALKIAHWKDSIVQRTKGPPVTFHVLVWDRDAYQQHIADLDGPMAAAPGNMAHSDAPPSFRRTRKSSLAEQIRSVFDGAPAAVKNRWRSKSDAAGWIRSKVDGEGDDAGSRRYVLTVLKPELDGLFPDAADGITEK